MKIAEKLFITTTMIIIFASFIVVSGCGDSSPADGDSDIPEFEWDGPGEDGDDDTIVDGDDVENIDGDSEDIVDGDEEADQPKVLGSISGKVTTSAALSEWNAKVELFDVNPMTEWGAEAVKTVEITGNASTTEETYQFDELEEGIYYLWVYIDVNNNDDEDDDVFAVFPEYIKIDPTKDNFKDRTDADMFVDAQNADLGSISGTLHLSPAYQGKRIMVVTSEFDTTNPEYWPNSVYFTEASNSETRTYTNTNLTNGSYYTMLYVFPGEGNPIPLVYRSPYDALEIDVDNNAKKDYTDQHFYLGVADPNFGSISGTLNLPVAIAGEIGVYIFATDNSDTNVAFKNQDSQVILMLDNDETSTAFNYTVGNLKTQEEIFVAGFINLDEDHIGLGYHDPGETPLSIDLNVTKDLTGIDMDVAITEVSGLLSVTHSKAPAMVRIALADMDVTIDGIQLKTEVYGYGGATDVVFDESGKASASKEYTMFPTYGGEFAIVAVVYTEKDGVTTESDYDETWCYRIVPGSVGGLDILPELNKVSIDGTVTSYDYDIDFDTTATGTIPLTDITYGTWICSAVTE